MSEQLVYDSDWTKFLRIGIDYGTGFLKLSVQYIYPGRKQDSDDIYDVILDDYGDDKVEIQQVGVWVNTTGATRSGDDGELIWGRRNVARWRNTHLNGDNDILSNWKLALKADLRDREGVRATIKALGCQDNDHSILASLECVITDHLRQIKSAVLDWCCKKHAANFGSHPPDWTSLQTETQIAVPAMWDAAAKGVMATAARDAGLGHVNLREEPQCVAGAVMSWLLKQDFIKANDAVLFFDVGAGTTDGAMVRFRDALTPGSRMVLERVGPSHGAQGGSLVVNDLVWEAFKNHADVWAHGGVVIFCRKLKIPQEECQRQVHEATETIKRRFGRGENGPFDILIYGRPTQHVTNAKPETISFDRDEVERWHDIWATFNENLLLEIVATMPRCRRAVFTGGGMQSRFLRQRLEDTLRSHGIMLCDVIVKFPCSRGALLHYLFETDEPIRNVSFFTLQKEEYDPEVHADTIPEPYQWDTNESVVHDRLVPIMRIADHREIESRPVQMNFHIDSTVPARVHFDIYCTVNPDRHQLHGPLRDAAGNVFPDLIQCPIAFVDLPSLYPPPYNFRPVSVQKGKDKSRKQGPGHYEVLGLVEMHKSNGAYELTFRLFDNKFEWQRDEDGK